MSQSASSHTWTSTRRGCILLLLAFCVGYPLWIIGVELAAREWYFRPLCRDYAARQEMTLIDYQRGGRSSSPACALEGDTVPVAEIGGTTATIVYIATDLVAVPAPFLAAIIFSIRRSTPARRRRR
jgi:hypothetical protein